MEPVRISIVFDAQGQPQLQRAGQSLRQLSTNLNALAANSMTAGRAFRVMENDLNRFAQSLHRATTQGVYAFNSAFEKTFSLFGQLARISFYAAIGQIAAMGFGLKRLAREFFDINEQFAGLEITLKSMFGSMTAARKVREELARITITSPLPFKDIANATRALGAMPALAPKFAQQIRGDTLSDPNGFLRKTIGLMEKMTTFRPDKSTSDAVFALREAIGGELRSLVRRFEFPAALLVQASGKPLDYLKTRPDEMVRAMSGAFDRLISDKAVRDIAKQPTRLIGNIIEQAVQIPLLQIGRAGEKQGKDSIYQRILDFGSSMLQRFGDFANVDRGPFGPQSEKISGALSRLFDTVVGKLDDIYEKGLKAANAGPLDVPGGGKIERTYFVFQKVIEYIVENFPRATDAIRNLGMTVLPIFQTFLKVLKLIGGALSWVTEKGGGWGGLAFLITLRSLPQMLRGIMTVVAEQFVTTAQAVRGAVLTMNLAGGAQARAMGLVAGGGARGNALLSTPGTIGAVAINNPALYNDLLLEQEGFRRNARGQLIHSRTKENAVGYFGQTYNARGAAPANPAHLPPGLLFAPGQRPEEILAGRHMRYNPTSEQFVWGPGGGRLGAAVGRPPTMAEMSQLDMRNNAQLGLRDSYRNNYRYMRGGGMGIAASGVGAATTSLLGRFGASAGISASLGTGAALATGALVSTGMAILIGMVAAGAISLIYDKTVAYAESKRSAEGQKFLEEKGLSPSARSAMTDMISAEGNYGRKLSQLLADIKTNPALAAYKQNADVAATATAMGTRGIGIEISKVLSEVRSGGPLTGPGGNTLATAATTASMAYPRQEAMTLQDITKFRAQLALDIERLQKGIGSGAKNPFAAEPVALESFPKLVTRTKDPTGAETTNIEDAVVRTTENAKLIIEFLQQQLQQTRRIRDEIVTLQRGALRDPSGATLMGINKPLSESDQGWLDTRRAMLENLQTPAGFMESSPRFERFMEGQKAYDLNPNMAQLIAANEAAQQDFTSKFAPLGRHFEIFGQDIQRLDKLTEVYRLGEELMRPDYVTGVSPAERSLQDQQAKIDKFLTEYYDRFGSVQKDEGGKEHPMVMAAQYDQAGKPTGKTVPMLFETFAKRVREQLTNQVFPQVAKESLEVASAAILQIPASNLQSIVVQLPGLFEQLMTASDSVTRRIVEHVSQSLEQTKLIFQKAGETTPVVAEYIPNLTRVIDELATLPSLDEVQYPEAAAGAAAQRAEKLGKISETLNQIPSQLMGLLPPALATDFENALRATKNAVVDSKANIESMIDSMNRAAIEMERALAEKSEGALFGNEIRGGSALGRVQMADVTKMARERYGISLGVNDTSFVNLPFDNEPGAKSPFQREAGLLKMLRETWIPNLTQNIELIDAQFAEAQKDLERSQLRNQSLFLKGKLRDAQELEFALTTKIEDGTRSKRMSDLDKALSAVKRMTDPTLGFKLGRRGSLKPETQWQSTRFGEADQRVSILQDQFNELNTGIGKPLNLRPDFTDALGIDTRGFNAVTGEVKRMEAFQKEYIRVSEDLRKMMQDPQNTPADIQHLRDLSEAWGELADDAERTRESIVGRGGVLGSFTEGFGGVVSQWEATAANWTQVGASLAETLSSSLSNSLVDIAMNAKNAGDAFRQFGASVAETAARLMMNKAVEALLGAAIGGIAGAFGSGGARAFGSSGNLTSYTGVTGNTMTSTINAPSMTLGRASGGLIPGTPSNRDNMLAMVASGEYVIPASVVKRYGSAHFDAYKNGAMPRFAEGGLVNSLPVNSIPLTGGGSSINAPVNVVVNIDNKGVASADMSDPAATDERSRALARTLQATVRDQLLREQRQGGSLYQMTRNRK